MASIPLAEALGRLAELISKAAKDTVVIVAGERAVRLTPVRVPRHVARHFGSAAGRVHVSADFDAPLDDFADYT